MPRPRGLKPELCHGKSSGRAFVTLNGKRKYLGKHGTSESRGVYDRPVGEWIASARASSMVRQSINKHAHRIKGVFKWSGENIGVPGFVFQNLRTVSPLKAGRTMANLAKILRQNGDLSCARTLASGALLPAPRP